MVQILTCRGAHSVHCAAAADCRGRLLALQCESRHRDSGCLPPTDVNYTKRGELVVQAATPLSNTASRWRIAHRQVHRQVQTIMCTADPHLHKQPRSRFQRSRSLSRPSSTERTLRHCHGIHAPSLHPSKKLNETLRPRSKQHAASAQLNTAPHPMPSTNAVNMKRFDILALLWNAWCCEALSKGRVGG
jgi:hypothetical protein